MFYAKILANSITLNLSKSKAIGMLGSSETGLPGMSWYASVCDYTGQYQLLDGSETSSTFSFFSSFDYGRTWTSHDILNFPMQMVSNRTGEFVVGVGLSNGYQISYDRGASWNFFLVR